MMDTAAASKKAYEQPLLPLNLANVNGDAVHSPPYRTVTIVTMITIPKLEIAMLPTSYLPPLVALLEGQRNAESVVSMRNVQSAHSNVEGVRRLGIRVGLVVKQLISHRHNFQLRLAL
jgi:hypothetical protein